MRKIRLFIASSLDGYIARESGAVDWLFTDQDYGYSAFYAQIDTVIMGRKTYETVLSFGEYAYADKHSLVVSKTLEGRSHDSIEFVGSNLIDRVEALRRVEGKDIWLVGGGELIAFFLRQRLLDELILSIHPIILGCGIPMILHDPALATSLTFKQAQSFSSGLLQVTYTLASQ